MLDQPKTSGWLTLTEDESAMLLELPPGTRIATFMEAHGTEKCGHCGTWIKSHTPRGFIEHLGDEGTKLGPEFTPAHVRESLEQIALAEERALQAMGSATQFAKGLDAIAIGDGDLVVIKVLPGTTPEQCAAVQQLVEGHTRQLGLRVSLLFLQVGCEITSINKETMLSLGWRPVSKIIQEVGGNRGM